MRHRSFLLDCTKESFKPRRSKDVCLITSPAREHDVALCHSFWLAVGAGFWTERCRWSQGRWRRHLQHPGVVFWIARVSAEEVGCFEITTMVRGAKIQGFGLLPEHRGRGLGRDLLTAATERAFELGVEKVWLHTATDDHPNALPNYLAGGYRIVKERELKNPIVTRISSTPKIRKMGA